MKIRKPISALVLALCGTFLGLSAIADVTIPYNEYSDSPTIGRGEGTSTDPRDPGYGAMKIFIEKVKAYTEAIPGGEKVIFQRNQSTGRAVSALRAGIQFANANAPKPVFSEPSWGFAYKTRSIRLGLRGIPILRHWVDKTFPPLSRYLVRPNEVLTPALLGRRKCSAGILAGNSD